MEIDLKIVATRRPDLLERTVASFATVGLSKFRIRSVSMNLDPAFGSNVEADRCREIVRNRFPDATIHEPAEPSFGGAVKRLWLEASDIPIFHLEDDWIALEPLPAKDVVEAFEAGYAGVTPLSVEHRWDGKGLDAIKAEPFFFMGLRLGRRRTGVHQFGTSPRFVLPQTARHVAQLLDPDLDPEKQMFEGAFAREIQTFRTRFMVSADRGPVIRDIGREWRDARGIRKDVRNARSVWSSALEPR